MKNQGHSMRKSIVQVLCVLLLLQGYPVLALQEAGFTVTPKPSPVGDWVGHWLGEVRRPLGRWHTAWSQTWEPAWAGVSAAGEELALDWEVASWAVAGALGLSGGGGGNSQPPVPEKPSYKAGERPEPVAFELAPELIAGKSALQEILLVPGWNLVSLPKAREATDPATVLESIAGGYTHVMSHDACDATDPWKLYDPKNPAESDLASIDPSKGLWIEATLPVDLLPEGELPPETTFSLCTGWNLVGFPAGQARPVRNALQSIEGKYVRVMALSVLRRERSLEDLRRRGAELGERPGGAASGAGVLDPGDGGCGAHDFERGGGAVGVVGGAGRPCRHHGAIRRPGDGGEPGAQRMDAFLPGGLARRRDRTECASLC